MNSWNVFAQPAWRSLVIALLHTLWQGAVLALLLIAGLRRVSGQHPQVRYLMALTAQFGVLLAGVTTWAILEAPPIRPQPVQALKVTTAGQGSVRHLSSPVMPTMREEPSTTMRWTWVQVLAPGWLAGVIVMLSRTTGSALATLRLNRGPLLTDRRLLDLVEGLRIDLGLRRRVRVVACPAEIGPAVLGVVWPTIVLPITFMTGQPADELRAILAHELAHIRRHDYLWNLAQMLVESLLFFNPVVWWLGRQVRVEREACCDATAVALTGRPIPGVELYAHRPEWHPGERYHFEAEGLTDAAGRFRFSNLPDRPVNLNDRNGLS